MNYIIEESMGFEKAISKFEKAIDKLEIKNNQAEPKNDKDKENKETTKELIKTLRHNLKVVKTLNSYSKEDFEDRGYSKKVKLAINTIMSEQKKTLNTLKDSKMVKYLKGIGGGLLAGGIVGAISYFINKKLIENPHEINFLNHSWKETTILPGGPLTSIMGLSKDVFEKYTPKEFMKFSAAEAGAWTALLTAVNTHSYYKDGRNINTYGDKKEKPIKEETYFPY